MWIGGDVGGIELVELGIGDYYGMDVVYWFVFFGMGFDRDCVRVLFR